MKKLLNISDLTKDDFIQIINYADDLVINKEAILKNKNIGLIFEKNSTRTRLSFQVGIRQLDGNFIDVKFTESMSFSITISLAILVNLLSGL